MSTQVGVHPSIHPQVSHIGNFLFQWMKCPDGWLDRSQMEYDPTAIVSTSSRTPPSAHHPSIHPSIHPPTHPQYTSTFGLLGTQGNVPLGTTIDLSFTEGGHVANFFTNSVPLVTRPFFLPFEWPGLVLCQLAAS